MRINPVITSLSVFLLAACSGPPKLPEPKGEFVPANPDVPSYLSVERQEQVQNNKTIDSPQIKPEDVKVSPKPVSRNTPISLPLLANIKFTGGTDKIELVRGDGNGMPLYPAVQKIVPTGWAIVLSDDVAKKFTAKVAWQGGDQWPYVLQRMLEANKLNALIDWSNSRVSLAFAEKTQEPVLPKVKTPTPDKLLKPTIQSKARDTKLPVGVDAKVGKNPFIVDAVAKTTVPVKKPQPVRLPVWRGEVGSTLKDTVFRWSASQICTEGGNWRVIWDTPVNYRIDAPLRFEGDFKTALNGIFGLYQYAQKPLYAFTNSMQCLIKVTDKG
ncbi:MULTISPECIES: toxin co-regulated pilus biosynthesis Q family protein [Serratia]|uniref:toxin co-regulated pilus biosynthesis Q family protein n=1 Tax=Serratia TaxID=613 RepID=UPI0009E29283|nr:toxin co-regulated pilus biosynthesis Q family protein [Serratia sp. 506_PEND]